MNLQRVAVLGLGTMGQGMAANLLNAGFQVAGYNRSKGREGQKTLVEKGLEEFEDPAPAVAGADAVLVCLSDDAALEEVLFHSGAWAHMSPGTLLLDMGTTSLAMTKRVAERATEKQLAFVDAPVTGSKLGAQAGSLTLMVGGAPNDVEAAGPVFTAVGSHVVHAGERVGDGQALKHCLNMTQAIVLEGVLEGYALAVSQGLSLDALSEVFEHSAGKTGVGAFKTPYLKNADFSPHFRLDLMQKDLHLALSTATALRVPLPLARAVSVIYDQAARAGLGPEDFLATAKLLGLPNRDHGAPGSGNRGDHGTPEA